jgi:hypothetical protein
MIILWNSSRDYKGLIFTLIIFIGDGNKNLL